MTATSIGRRQPKKPLCSLPISTPIGTYRYGRPVAVSETPEVIPGLTPAIQDFARIWQEATRIAYSKSRETVSRTNARLERNFDPRAILRWKSAIASRSSVSGPTLAAHAIRAGLVDECHVVVVPSLLGRGLRVLPGDVRLTLNLMDEHRLGNGWV